MQSRDNFNPVEALLIGLEIEKDGAAFYSRAAGKSSHRDVRNQLLELAEMEEEHIRVFKGLIDQEKGGGENLQGYDSDAAADFLAFLTRGDLFKAMKQEPPDSVRKTLEIAVEAEKNSILYYTELRNISGKEGTKKAFQRLIDEEKNHFVMLSGILENLKD